jgi:uncharacterized protein (DUF58 family)
MPAIVSRRTNWPRPGARDARRLGGRVVGRRYHFHVPGVAYAATVIVIVLGAINGQNNLLFWLFGLGVAGLLLAGVLSGAALMGLELSREVPRVGAVGEPLDIRYTLRNRNRFVPAFALLIEELPASPVDDPTWPARLPAFAANCPHVPVRGQASSVVTVTPTTRGRCTFARVRVSTTFPFGLTRKSVTFEQPAEVLVRPRPIPVDPEVLRRDAGRGQGGRAVRRGRTGDEFFALREYVPGDSTRRIAWRASARLARPVVRELAERPGRRVWIAPRYAEDSPLSELVVEVAAGLVRAALAAGYEPGVDAVAPDGATQGRIAPAPGLRQVGVCLDALALAGAGTAPPGRLDAGDILVLVTDDPARRDPRADLTFTPADLGLDMPPPAPHQSAARAWRDELLARLGLRPREAS